jgi:hypothetical protein
MYSKQESTAIKRKFWTTLGMYMKPVPSAWQDKANWLNYKTGIKDVFFRMHADHNMARISIELTHSDPLIRQLYFDHFGAMKGILYDYFKEDWVWDSTAIDEFGRPFSIIKRELESVNIMKEAHWPILISFFKPRLIALDHFWAEAKDSMEGW